MVAPQFVISWRCLAAALLLLGCAPAQPTRVGDGAEQDEAGVPALVDAATADRRAPAPLEDATAVVPEPDGRVPPDAAPTPPVDAATPAVDVGIDRGGAEATAGDTARAPDVAPAATISRYGKQWLRYAIVAKTSDARSALLEASAAAEVARTGKIPEGAVVLLEVGSDPLKSVGFIAFRVKRNGVWRNGLTRSLDSVDFIGGTNTGCDGCHDRAPDEALYTMPSLKRFLASGVLESFRCNQSGNGPCSAATYERAGR